MTMTMILLGHLRCAGLRRCRRSGSACPRRCRISWRARCRRILAPGRRGCASSRTRSPRSSSSSTRPCRAVACASPCPAAIRPLRADAARDPGLHAGRDDPDGGLHGGYAFTRARFLAASSDRAALPPSSAPPAPWPGTLTLGGRSRRSYPPRRPPFPCPSTARPAPCRWSGRRRGRAARGARRTRSLSFWRRAFGAVIGLAGSRRGVGTGWRVGVAEERASAGIRVGAGDGGWRPGRWSVVPSSARSRRLRRASADEGGSGGAPPVP